MKYTITIQRKIGKNTFDSLLVLITEYYNEYLNAQNNLIMMFKHNTTFIKSDEFKYEDITHLYIEYSFKGQ